MSADFDRDLRQLWQTQPREEQPVSIDDFRAHVYRFDRNMRLLYAVNSVALLLALIGDPWEPSGETGFLRFARNELLMDVGWGVTLAALLYVGYHGREYLKWVSAPATLGLHGCADVSGLPPAPRHDISTHPWRYLIAYLPGLTLMLLGVALNPPRAQSVIMAALGLAFFAGVVWLNTITAPGPRQPADPR